MIQFHFYFPDAQALFPRSSPESEILEVPSSWTFLWNYDRDEIKNKHGKTYEIVYRSASRSGPTKEVERFSSQQALMNCVGSKEMSAVWKKTPMDNKTFLDIDTYSIYMWILETNIKRKFY